MKRDRRDFLCYRVLLHVCSSHRLRLLYGPRRAGSLFLQTWAEPAGRPASHRGHPAWGPPCRPWPPTAMPGPRRRLQAKGGEASAAVAGTALLVGLAAPQSRPSRAGASFPATVPVPKPGHRPGPGHGYSSTGHMLPPTPRGLLCGGPHPAGFSRRSLGPTQAAKFPPSRLSGVPALASQADPRARPREIQQLPSPVPSATRHDGLGHGPVLRPPPWPNTDPHPLTSAAPRELLGLDAPGLAAPPLPATGPTQHRRTADTQRRPGRGGRGSADSPGSSGPRLLRGGRHRSRSVVHQDDRADVLSTPVAVTAVLP